MEMGRGKPLGTTRRGEPGAAPHAAHWHVPGLPGDPVAHPRLTWGWQVGDGTELGFLFCTIFCSGSQSPLAAGGLCPACRAETPASASPEPPGLARSWRPAAVTTHLL